MRPWVIFQHVKVWALFSLASLLWDNPWGQCLQTPWGLGTHKGRLPMQTALQDVCCTQQMVFPPTLYHIVNLPFIAFWLDPSGIKRPRFVVASVEMDWAMSSCTTDQEKGSHASEYSVARWCSSLKVSPGVVSVFHTHTWYSTLHIYRYVLIIHLQATVCFDLSLHRKGRWTERWAVKEKKKFSAAEGADSEWRAPDQRLIRGSDGQWPH